MNLTMAFAKISFNMRNRKTRMCHCGFFFDFVEHSLCWKHCCDGTSLQDSCRGPIVAWMELRFIDFFGPVGINSRQDRWEREERARVLFCVSLQHRGRDERATQENSTFLFLDKTFVESLFCFINETVGKISHFLSLGQGPWRRIMPPPNYVAEEIFWQRFIPRYSKRFLQIILEHTIKTTHMHE